MHTITIQPNDAGTFDVLINGFSYRIHRNLSEESARIRAAEIAQSFRDQGQRVLFA